MSGEVPSIETLTVKPGTRLILRYDQTHYSDEDVEGFLGLLEARLGVRAAALPMNIGVLGVEMSSAEER